MVQKVVGFYIKDGKTRPLTQRNARGYTANKKQTIKHVSKYTPERTKFAQETSKLDNWQNHKRIDEYLKEPETKDIANHVDGFFDNKQVSPIIVEGEKQTRRYSTGSILKGERVTAPTLHKAKVEQRRRVVERMPRGAVLELYAGKGYLTKEVYSKKATRVILVDSDKKALQSANTRLKGRVRKEIYVGNNKKWIEEMDPAEFKDLTLVDFDAFGTPTETMSNFFDHYPIKKPLYVTATDGSALYYQQNPNARGKKSAKRLYHNVPRDYGTVRGQVDMLSTFMDKEGQKHHFKVEPISIAKGNNVTIYAGYLLKPT